MFFLVFSAPASQHGQYTANPTAEALLHGACTVADPAESDDRFRQDGFTRLQKNGLSDGKAASVLQKPSFFQLAILCGLHVRRNESFWKVKSSLCVRHIHLGVTLF